LPYVGDRAIVYLIVDFLEGYLRLLRSVREGSSRSKL